MVPIKTAAEIAIMRRAGVIAAEVAGGLRGALRQGMTTGELDRLAEKRIRALGGVPGFKGLYGFPASVCVSVNEQVVHGVPGDRRIKAGDLVSVDIGVVYRDFCADTAFSVVAGEAQPETARLLKETEAALAAAIAACRAGAKLGDLGHTIQLRAEAAGFGVVREYGGHGIGRRMHEEPWIANFGLAGTGLELAPGMVLALEPMLTAGSGDVTTVDENGWPVVVTADGSWAAHCEHTVAVTSDGPVVLTGQGRNGR